MGSTSLPLNLTALLSRAGQLDTGAAPGPLCPGMRFDLLDAASLQLQGACVAEMDELFVVIAGYGGIRCDDGSLMDITAGDILYFPSGTGRAFEALSRKFAAQRLTFSIIKPPD